MAGQIHLWVPYYIDRLPERRVETETCLERNLENPHIDNVTLVTGDSAMPAEGLDVVRTELRPTFADVFRVISEQTSDDVLNVVSNCDIWFDATILRLWEMASPSVFFALARDDMAARRNRYSQDVWAFLGRPRPMNAAFWFGVPGCDNVIAHSAKRAGYSVVNVGLSVVCHHEHGTEIRNYTIKQRLPKPYMVVPVSTIEREVALMNKANRPGFRRRRGR